MLYVKKLDPRATVPTVAHTGDLGYDLYALSSTYVTNEPCLVPHKVRTGIAVSFKNNWGQRDVGFLIRDRSSMAAKGVFVTGGVIDANYTGEIIVMLRGGILDIKAGDKIAQLIPIPCMTEGGAVEVDALYEPDNSRGGRGFGSSGG